MQNQPRHPTGPKNWRAPGSQTRRQINAQPRHSQSLTWQSPTYRNVASNSKLQLNELRKKVCPRSPFWHPDFDLPKHRQEWQDGETRRGIALADHERAQEDEKHRLERDIGEQFPPQPPIRSIFDNKPMLASPDGSLGAVLGYKTIFCPNFLPAKEDVAPWPNKHEMDYEGESRLATDRLHRRYLPLPRVQGEDVNWQHRVAIPQYLFEEYYCNFPKTWDNPLGINWEDVYFRMLRVEALEFTSLSDEIDEEGKHALACIHEVQKEAKELTGEVHWVDGKLGQDCITA
ncbi:hypothetical protein LTS10_008571 [Elasticomyces elasticus]|nr:hypothetical protein LTS10_008571 [Elasticomyces elasticus]